MPPPDGPAPEPKALDDASTRAGSEPVREGAVVVSSPAVAEVRRNTRGSMPVAGALPRVPTGERRVTRGSMPAASATPIARVPTAERRVTRGSMPAASANPIGRVPTAERRLVAAGALLPEARPRETTPAADPVELLRAVSGIHHIPSDMLAQSPSGLEPLKPEPAAPVIVAPQLPELAVAPGVDDAEDAPTHQLGPEILERARQLAGLPASAPLDDEPTTSVAEGVLEQARALAAAMPSPFAEEELTNPLGDAGPVLGEPEARDAAPTPVAAVRPTERNPALGPLELSDAPALRAGALAAEPQPPDEVTRVGVLPDARAMAPTAVPPVRPGPPVPDERPEEITATGPHGMVAAPLAGEGGPVGRASELTPPISPDAPGLSSKPSRRIGAYSRANLADESRPEDSDISRVVRYEAIKNSGHRRYGYQAALAAVIIVLALGTFALLLTRHDHPSLEVLQVSYPYGFSGGQLGNGRTAPGAAEVLYDYVSTVDCGAELCQRYRAHTPDGSFSLTMDMRKDGSDWHRVAER